MEDVGSSELRYVHGNTSAPRYSTGFISYVSHTLFVHYNLFFAKIILFAAIIKMRISFVFSILLLVFTLLMKSPPLTSIDIVPILT